MPTAQAVLAEQRKARAVPRWTSAWTVFRWVTGAFTLPRLGLLAFTVLGCGLLWGIFTWGFGVHSIITSAFFLPGVAVVVKQLLSAIRVSVVAWGANRRRVGEDGQPPEAKVTWVDDEDR